MFIYSVDDAKWNNVPSDTLQGGPAPRGGASMSTVMQNGTFFSIIIGGYPLNDTKNVYIYSWNGTKWMTLPHLPDLPELAYHTAVTTGQGNIIVFGGEDKMEEALSGGTYVITFNSTLSTVNASLLKLPLSPSARKGQGATYLDNQMILYGGDYGDKIEDMGNVWQFVVEAECKSWNSCGECLLASCFWCVDDKSNHTYCVAGKKGPFVPNSCPSGGWNTLNISNCRLEKKPHTVLVVITIVVLVVIAVLVVATYVVDCKKGQATGGGYEPIIG